jgi:hypothetical protein
MTRLWKRALAISLLAIPLMGNRCDPTTLTSSEIDKIVCETADFYRFKPYRSTFQKMTAEEQAFLMERLDAYRKENCPAVLKGLGNGTATK